MRYGAGFAMPWTIPTALMLYLGPVQAGQMTAGRLVFDEIMSKSWAISIDEIVEDGKYECQLRPTAINAVAVNKLSEMGIPVSRDTPYILTVNTAELTLTNNQGCVGSMHIKLVHNYIAKNDSGEMRWYPVLLLESSAVMKGPRGQFFGFVKDSINREIEELVALLRLANKGFADRARPSMTTQRPAPAVPPSRPNPQR